MDSSEPDLNEGKVGRVHYDWIRRQFQEPAELKVLALHHHLLPIPGTGRERSTVMDAGDLLEVLIHAGVHVVLSGHKHVPYVWRLENMYVANAGTVSSLRVRGYTKPCYNVLEFDRGEVKILRKFPFGDEHRDGALLALGRAVPPGARAAGAGAHRAGRRVAPARRPARSSRPIHRWRGDPDPMRTLVLVDGEHYPPVTRWGIETARRPRARRGGRAHGRRHREDRSGVAARPRRPDDRGRRRPDGRARRGASTRSSPRSCSTCPTSPSSATGSGWSSRRSRSPGASPYLGADFRLDPPVERPADRRPHARRDRHRQAHGQDRDQRRGRPAGRAPGPRPGRGRDGPRRTARAAGRRGRERRPRRACSSSSARASTPRRDYLEDALTTGVTTIGARRAGGGLAGAPYATNVREAAELAAARGPGVVILEGSGSAVPPVPWDAGVLVVPASAPARVPGRLPRSLSPVAVGPRGCYHGVRPDSLGPRTSPHSVPTSALPR